MVCSPKVVALVLFLSTTIGCAWKTDSTLRDFTSDGCSLFVDGTFRDAEKWCDCCFQHDIAYWRGGSEEERKKADETLRDCVLDHTGDKALAQTMYLGVRAGGQPGFPTWYRWGYGWSYGRGYKPLTTEEQQQVRAKLDDYHKRHPAGYCGEKHGGIAARTNDK
jgi:hypothetical protein